jgi:hypothetical protein
MTTTKQQETGEKTTPTMMASNSDDRHYPNLTSCRITLVGASAGASRVPVKLPQDVLTACNRQLNATPYDFALGE